MECKKVHVERCSVKTVRKRCDKKIATCFHISVVNALDKGSNGLYTVLYSVLERSYQLIVFALPFIGVALYNVGHRLFNPICLSAFRALLPSANHYAEWSGWVWQPSADSNGLLEHHYCQQRAVTPDPESLNTKFIYTVKIVDEVVRHPHLVTQDQFTQVSKKVSDIPAEIFTINIELFWQPFTNVELLRQSWKVSKAALPGRKPRLSGLQSDTLPLRHTSICLYPQSFS